MKNRHVVMYFIFLLSFSFCFAQETTSEIQGAVHDAKGEGLQGVTVTALHMPSGTKYTTTTRKDGRYNLPNVRIGGPYTITVSSVGYNEEKLENVNLLLGQEFKADFELSTQAQQLAEVVVASRQGRVFNTGHTGSQEIINRSQIERLPTINRSLQDFTKLTPSANGLSFGGRSSGYNNVTVDGANFNNAFGLSATLGGQANSQPISIDAIEQIQVNISPYDVRQGGFSGAGVNSVTRSGTNQYKGSVYHYFRNENLQGYKVRTVTVPKTNLDYKLRGANVGGAILPNKLFFFISGEQERISQPATTLVANKPGQTAVPGVISQAVADTLDALRNFLIQKFGYDPGSYQNYNYNTQSDKITVRLDWNVSKSSTVTLKYNYLKSIREIPASNSGAPNGNRQPSNFGLPFSGSGYKQNNNLNIVIGEVNTRIGNKFSNKFQIGYSAIRDFRQSLAGSDFPLVDILNAAGQTYTTFGYEPFTYNNLLNTDVFQLSDIFTYYAGRHELTFGTQNYRKKFKNGFAPNYEGAYQFNSFSDFYSSVNTGKANAKSYALQYALTKDGSFPFAFIGATEIGFFAQDKWRIKNNLTVTYGLRVDVPIFDNKFESNPNVPALTFRDGKHYNVGDKPNSNPLFSPRAGFNWDVFNNQKTQVRGGIGSFSGPPPFVWISNQASNNGVQFGSFSTSNVAFKADINAYRPSSAAVNTSYSLVFTDKDFKYPQVLKTSIGVDQKLPWDVIATVEYSYSKDLNAVNFENVNLPATGTPLAGPDNRLRFSASKIYGGVGGASASNPNISSAILMKNYSKGFSYFLTFQLQRTFKNLYASVAYTYSKSRSLNDGGSIAASMWRDRPVSGDPNAPELGYSNFYQPHRVIAQASYRVEYCKHFATSIGLIFEAAPSPSNGTTLPNNSAGSCTYNGDPNNDGTGGNNDLIYIPRNQSEIVLVPVGNSNDTRTPAIIWNQLNNFINQDPYLSKHRGEYAQRNAVVLPYYKQLNLNLTQDFYVKSGKDRHTLRVTFDMFNVGNFINRNWGITRTFATSFSTSQNAASFLRFEGIAPAGDPNAGKPRYSFPYQDPSNQIPFVNSFQDNTFIFLGNSVPSSRWQAQIGFRYLFN